jgi:hypothetical protein
VTAAFEEVAGRPNVYAYRLLLRESPPLPPPAELTPFGGLDGADVGFDTDVLSDIADAAGQLQDAVEAVNDAVKALEALSALTDLSAGNPVEPIQDEVGSLGGVGEAVGDAVAGMGDVMSSGGGG